ncbi:hypothetical protein Tco_1424035, partial [Tanacetum coccineum]
MVSFGRISPNSFLSSILLLGVIIVMVVFVVVMVILVVVVVAIVGVVIVVAIIGVVVRAPSSTDYICFAVGVLFVFLRIQSTKLICGGLIMQKIHGLSLFEDDDDNCLFTMCGLPTAASWQGDHTQIVVATMEGVWHGPDICLSSIASAATLVALQYVEVAEAMTKKNSGCA